MTTAHDASRPDQLVVEEIFRRLFVSIEGLPGRWAATIGSRELPTRVSVGPTGAVTAVYEGEQPDRYFRSVGWFAIAHGLKSPPNNDPKKLRAWLKRLALAQLKLEAKRGRR